MLVYFFVFSFCKPSLPYCEAGDGSSGMFDESSAGTETVLRVSQFLTMAIRIIHRVQKPWRMEGSLQ